MVLYSIQHSVSNAIEIVDSTCSSSVGHVNNSYAMNIKITPMVTIASTCTLIFTLIFSLKLFFFSKSEYK